MKQMAAICPALLLAAGSPACAAPATESVPPETAAQASKPTAAAGRLQLRTDRGPHAGPYSVTWSLPTRGSNTCGAKTGIP